MITVKKKASIWWAVQYNGLIHPELLSFLDGAQQCLNTVTLNGVWKLQMQTDSGNIDKASVNDWILKDSNGNFKIVKETKLATEWEIVP